MITGAAKLAGVLGWPVEHSLSPRLHNFWLDRYGIDGAYVPLPVRPTETAKALRSLRTLGFMGCNLTLPHKTAALEVVDVVDARAQDIGAINTVVIDKSRAMHGFNTDWIGFLRGLEDAVESWRGGTDTAVVMGAGGAARAVIYALTEAGVKEIRIVNRTRKNAEELAKWAKGRAQTVAVAGFDETERAFDGADMLVNATSLGMAGQPLLDISLDGLSERAIVCDIVYAPLQTPLLERAAARGNIIVDGLGMLMHQAAAGFEGWFGHEAEADAELRAHLMEVL